jgi:flagellar protein FliO/FliZ
MMHRLRLAFQALSFLPIAASAAETQSGMASSAPSALSFGGLFQVLFSLLIVLAAIAGTAWLLKRYGPSQVGGAGMMKVLGGVAVGPRERLVLVEVGETWLIVGVAQGQVNAVHSMARPADAPVPASVSPVSSPFAERLKQMLGSKQG